MHQESPARCRRQPPRWRRSPPPPALGFFRQTTPFLPRSEPPFGPPIWIKGQTNCHKQHEWARWLADHDVAVVAGAGPHVVQPTEFHGAAMIAYSLGNAVYPLALQGQGSGAVWEVTVQANGDVLESRWRGGGSWMADTDQSGRRD
ncbi:MAG: CapA family protein [Verrucomicrobiota bacterium]